MNKIRVLVISASLPPFNDSSTLQLIDRVRRLPEHGFEIVFVGPEMPQGVDSQLLQQLPDRSTIVRTKQTTYDRVTGKLLQVPGGKVLALVYANAMYRIAAPDVRVGWDKLVVDMCKQMLNNMRPDIIITHSGSFTAHIAGRRLSQHFSVPWVADLGDPLSLVDPDSWIYSLKARRNRVLEQQTIPYASGLVFTTKETLNAYQSLMRDQFPKAIVLPCYGYNPSDFLPLDPDARISNVGISLSHIGTAFRSNRNLIPLIQALGTLEQAKALIHNYNLTVIGPHSRAFEKVAQYENLSSVTFSERVSYQESVDWINRSNVLIIVGNAGLLQIPGKIYPYLGSGRPILYIGQLPYEQDPAALLLAQFPGVLFAQNERNSIETTIRQIDHHYLDLCEKAVHRLEMSALHKYESSVVGDRFAQFIRETFVSANKRYANS